MTATSGDRPTILYLAGIPRTGSTVLGQALGSIPGVVFAGELNFFWRRFSRAELCSCRRPLPGCPFWSTVVGRAYGGVTPGRAKELAELERRVLRRQPVAGLAARSWQARGGGRRGRAGGGRGGWQVRSMLEERAQLYRSIADVAGAKWIVDAGKEPLFGTILSRLDCADLATIHLVRDPRGVAFSWQKQVRSDSEPSDMPRQSAAMTALDWLLQNIMVQLVLQRLSRIYVRVRYEDLASQLADVVHDISRRTGVPTPAPSPTAGQQVPAMAGHHLVAGNPGVRQLADRGLRLSPDEEWRTKLPAGQRRLVTGLCASLMVAYGYPLRSRT